MPKRNSPNDFNEIDDLNNLNEIVNDKRIAKRATEKKTRRDRHYEKQFIKNTIKTHLENKKTMTKPEIIQQLKSIVKPYVKNQAAFESLNEETDFIRDLEINSANLVDIILDVEEAFEIVIDNQEMENMLNIQATLTIIENKLAQKE